MTQRQTVILIASALALTTLTALPFSAAESTYKTIRYVGSGLEEVYVTLVSSNTGASTTVIKEDDAALFSCYTTAGTSASAGTFLPGSFVTIENEAYVHSLHSWFSGNPASNADGEVHARLTDIGTTLAPKIRLEFEDLPEHEWYDIGEPDYNDCVVDVEGPVALVDAT